MKTLIIPPVHSHSDLITNSSSETFICGDLQLTEIDSVKGAIQILWKNFLKESAELVGTPVERYNNEWLAKLTKMNLFGDIFAEPTFSKWDFDMCHDLLYGDFFLLYHVKRRLEYECENPELNELREEFNCLVDVYEASRDESEENRYNICINFFEPAIKAFTTWFYTVCLPANGFAPDDSIFKLNFDFCEYYGLYIRVTTESDNPAHVDFTNFADMCLSYDCSVKKNQLILNSVEDNSIPYEFFSKIEEVFHAERRHLG